MTVPAVSTTTEPTSLQHALTIVEAHRALLGDEVVETTLAVLQEELERLDHARAQPVRVRSLTPAALRAATVLVADVTNFTALSETLDAEDVAALMNQLWQQLDTVIVSHNGQVAKHVGDAVIALWGESTLTKGADDPHKLAAEHAVQAALEMQNAVRMLEANTSADFAKAYPHLAAGLSIRIGVNTGPVALGALGVAQEFTAMGDAVSLAAQLQQAAPPGEVMVSVNTYRLVRGRFDLEAEAPQAKTGERLHAYLAAPM